MLNRILTNYDERKSVKMNLLENHIKQTVSGRPAAKVEVKPGEIVIDLECGAGFDVFLLAKKTGENGRVIGIDITGEMIKRAKQNAEKLNLKNTEFRQGEIKNLPVSDSTADVIISNCVSCLSSDKKTAYNEMFRVLKPGGRISISYLLRSAEIQGEMKTGTVSYSGQVSGLTLPGEERQLLKKAGFTDITIVRKDCVEKTVKEWKFFTNPENIIFTEYINAVKPGGRRASAGFQSSRHGSDKTKTKGFFSQKKHVGKLAILSKGLAHPARVEIVRLLANIPPGHGCVCGNIVNALPLAQSSVSQHLKVLKDTGWIVSETDGTRVRYCIAEDVMEYYTKLMKRLI